MANYEVPANPVYDANVRKLENEDTISADDTFNPLIARLVENTAAVRKEAGEKAKADLSNVAAGVLSGITVGNADTVGGKTVADLQNYNNLTEKPNLALKAESNLSNVDAAIVKAKVVEASGGGGKLNADTIGGKTVAELQNYNSLINKPTIPTSLPANGGNADTVGNKTAAVLQNYENLTNTPMILRNLVDGNGYNSLRGRNTKSDYAMGENAIAEGVGTVASGNHSHAEGSDTTASGICSHVEGAYTSAKGDMSHAEGTGTSAKGDVSHAEGESTTANGLISHAEGIFTQANGETSHAEGNSTTASGRCSHTEGVGTVASGNYSHAEGCNTIASRDCSHVEGNVTIALDYQHVQGHYNKGTDAGGNYSNTTGSAFIIGNGTGNTTKSNCFRVQYDGKTYAKGAYSSSGADYAELFEWADGNPNNDDRRGLFVALQGTKIQIANSPSDNVIGIISSNPAVIGNNHSETWKDMYITDMWGELITEYKTIPAEYETRVSTEIVVDENGNMQEIPKEEQILIHAEYETDVPIVNPDYNGDEEYIPRHERKEWGIVGMFGQLILQDDGSCTAGGYCQCANDGIGTKSETGYYVMERVKEQYIKVLFK